MLRNVQAIYCDQSVNGSRGNRSAVNWSYAAFWLAVVTFAIMPGSSSAQMYKSDAYDTDYRSRGRTVVRECINNPASYAAQKKEFLEYFQKYYFPLMTQATPEELGELGKLRYDLFRQYLWEAQSPQLQADLTALTRQYMFNVFKDAKYHPGVRYNAILILGMLDAEYASADVPGSEPKPLPDVSKLLTEIVNAAGKSRLVTPPILVGALVGLERHAQHRTALDPQKVDAIEEAMVGLIAQPGALENLDTEVRDWVRRQAASVLANLGQIGANGRALKAMLLMIEDDEASLDERCQVAAMLERMELTAAAGAAAAKSVILLADDVGQHQAEKAVEFEDTRIGGGRGVYRSSRGYGRGRGGGYGDRGEVEYERRGLVTQLNNLATGLSAVEVVVEGDAKTQVADVLASVNTVRTMATKNDTLDFDLAAEVKRMSRQIKRTASLLETPDAAATTADAESAEEMVK